MRWIVGVAAVLVLLAVGVVIALVAPWGDGDEARSVDSLLQVLPRNADTFTLLDLEEVRDERLDELEVQVAALFDSDRLYEWGIDLDDIDALLLSDLDNADALTVLQGIFSTEDVADALDDAGYRDDVYRDIEIWVERRSDIAVALVAEDTIIIGEGERVEDSIDAFIGATRSIEQEDDVSEIVDSLGDAPAYSVTENCDYRGCRRWARGVRLESGELVAVFIFAFRDEETASDAERDIDDDLEERGFEPSIDLDGSLVTVTLPVEEEEFRLNRSAVLDFTSREGEEPPVEQRPAPAADDHSDAIAGATRISVGDRLNGDIEHEGDVDLFSFRARSGYYYTIRVRHGTNPDTILTLLDSDGRFITEDDDSGGDGEPWLEWAAPSSAIYYVEVRGFAGGDIGTYRIEMGESDPEPTPAPQPTLAPAPTTVPARAADDHADGISGATRISVGDGLNGDIEREGDVDLFSFRAQSGYNYTIRVRHGANPDTILTLLDSDGRLITEDDDSGGDGEPRLEWAAPSTGNYYVEVRGFDGDATGTYRIDLDESDPEPVPAPTAAPAPPPVADDHSDIIAGATRISLGDTLNGDIEHEGDVDLFSFRARSDYYYTIRVRHGTNPDTILTLLDSDGRSITEDDDSGGDGEPWLEWAAPSSGIYYVEVRGIDSDATGTYRIEIDESDPEPTPVLWSYETGDSVLSSPAVSGGVVYVGSDSDVYALDASTGDLIWSYETGDYVFSSPAVSGGVVYVGSTDNRVYALDASTGDLIWSYETGDEVWSSPEVSGGVVYVGSRDNRVYALDASTGDLIWSYETGGWVHSSPTVSGDVVYVGSGDGRLYALDASTGDLIWSYETGGWVNSSPAVFGGVVYVGSNDNRVYALDASTGDLIWSYETGDDGVYSSPAVSGGVVYVGSRDNRVYALDASTGDLIWSYGTGAWVWSSPAVAGGVVYVGSEDNRVYALDASTGDLIWSYGTGGAVLSSPAVSGGVVYVGSEDNRVYAIEGSPERVPPVPSTDEGSSGRGSGSESRSRLDQVRDRGRVICASRNDVPGLGYLDERGNPIGFDIDLCRAVAAAVLGDPNAIEIRPITAAEREPVIRSGEVDMLVRTITWTTWRDATWGNFAETMLYDGQGFMVNRDRGLSSAMDLNGATVCVVGGTTLELDLEEFSLRNHLNIKPLTLEDYDAALSAYQRGRCDALTRHRLWLAALGSSFLNPDAHVILPETISEEPMGPVVPHGDDQWFDIVKTVMGILIYAEAYGVTSGSVPIAATGDFRIDRLFGLEASFGQESLGLSQTVAQEVIKAVGNYGEIYDRNLGPGGIGLPRDNGRNALWADAPCNDCPKGGQIYSAPMGYWVRGSSGSMSQKTSSVSRLSQVRERGKLICASRNDVPGFGYLDDRGNNVGFDIDLCRAVAAAVLGDPNAVEIRLISVSEREPVIRSGEVDMLVRTVTWTMARDADWGNFAQTMLYDGQGFMVNRGQGLSSAMDLDGATVCVTGGTTLELNLEEFSHRNQLNIKPLTLEDYDAALSAYQRGRCDALTDDRSWLAALGSSFLNPDVHVILPETISEEPLGPVVPHGDDQWFDIVKTVMGILIYAEAYDVTSGSVPIAATGNVQIDRLFGLASSFGFGQESLGLSQTVAQDVIRAVGNYGEIYDRNLGPGGIGLPRENGRNALWADAPCDDCPKGGQIYSAPVR